MKHRLDDSPIWADLLKIRMVYLQGRQIHTKDGKKTLFWEDSWLIGGPLCVAHPVLYDLCKDKLIIVHEMLVRNGHPNVYRWLHNPLFEEWLGIVEKTYSFNFSSQKDIVTWKWNSKKTFTMKSVYNRLSSGSESNRFNHIWKSKIPYKIKIFTWLLEKGAVLTKDNMIRRRWAGDPSCKFCDQPETINHLFFQCLVAKCIWALIGQCLGAKNTPRDCEQYKQWIRKWLPNGQAVYHFGFAAVCWAIWKCHNKAVFDA